MSALLEETSTITAKGQTTIPKAVRRAPGLGTGDRIAFRVDERGVSLRRAEPEIEDPAMAIFLAFLARDIGNRPETVAELPRALLARIDALVADVEVRLDEEIAGDAGL